MNKLQKKGICAICFCEVTEVEAYETPILGNKGVKVRELCVKCRSGLGSFENDHDNLLRAACYVLVRKANLTDIRIGLKLLLEQAQREERKWRANARRVAKQQLADVEETLPTVEPVGPETFI